MRKTYLNDAVTLLSGDCMKEIKKIPDNFIDSVVTDPPYALVSITKRFGKEDAAPAKGNDAYMRASAGFMGKQWDTGEVVFNEEFWKEVLRVLKPGGHVAAFGASRGYHRMASAIEDAGFEIRDSLMWLYGCYSEDTECLTKNGWKKYFDLTVEDEILQWDHNTNKLSWINPIEIYIYDAPKNMYHFQNRHTNQLLTENHTVFVKIQKHSRNVKECSYISLEAKDIKKHWIKNFPLAGELSDGIRNEYAYGIGWWLTDAWIHSNKKACMFSQSKIKTLKKLKEYLSTQDCVVSEYKKSPKKENHNIEHTFYVSGNFADYLIKNFPNRELTMDVMNWDYESRFQLLEGLLDGDGSKPQKQKSEIFYSKNKNRLDIVQALCVSLNIRNHIDYNNDCIYLNRKTNTTQLQSRHICENIEYNGKKVWCLSTQTGAFVVRRDGKSFISGNSGFPKSHDVSKGIDKELGVEREKIRVYNVRNPKATGGGKDKMDGATRPYIERAIERGYHEMDSDISATAAAAAWAGWGTALKPAFEPIVLARKPLSEKTIAANVLKWGTGALNIDGCRVGPEGGSRTIVGNQFTKTVHAFGNGLGAQGGSIERIDDLGRWPANICISYNNDTYKLIDNPSNKELLDLAKWLNENT